MTCAGLEGLEMHHIVVQGWEQGVQAEQNVTLVSIASIQDPKLAPKGKHTLHAYHPATEPFSHWQHLQVSTFACSNHLGGRVHPLFPQMSGDIPKCLDGQHKMFFLCCEGPRGPLEGLQ